MPIKSEVLQNLEAKSEENVEQKPTKWKEFKTEHPKAAKILKVGAIGTGVSLAAATVFTPIGAASALVCGSTMLVMKAPVVAATLGAVAGATSGVILGVARAEIEAEKFDKKQRRQIEIDNDKFADIKTANIDSQIEVKIESKKIASL